jgi:hypothetical protein
LVQIQQDKALVDRLFPYIIQKIDGQTLLQKIDAKTLAGKLLPHIRVTLRLEKARPILTLIITFMQNVHLAQSCGAVAGMYAIVT